MLNILRSVCPDYTRLTIIVVEAMATMRPYGASLGLHEALQTITTKAGIYFDRHVCGSSWKNIICFLKKILSHLTIQ